MQEQIGILHELRDVDERLRSLKRRIAARYTERQRKQMEADLVAKALTHEKERMASAESRHLQADREVETCRARKADSEAKSQSVKTNVEYQALLREISAMEQKAREWEEQVLKAMEEEETARHTVARVQDELEEKERIAAQETKHLEEEVEAARGLEQELGAKRTTLISALSAQTRSRYERLWASKGDSAIVSVRQGSCGGCHYHLPPQLVNEVRAGRRLLLCEGCGRILVWAEE